MTEAVMSRTDPVPLLREHVEAAYAEADTEGLLALGEAETTYRALMQINPERNQRMLFQLGALKTDEFKHVLRYIFGRVELNANFQSTYLISAEIGAVLIGQNTRYSLTRGRAPRRILIGLDRLRILLHAVQTAAFSKEQENQTNGLAKLAEAVEGVTNERQDIKTKIRKLEKLVEAIRRRRSDDPTYN